MYVCIILFGRDGFESPRALDGVDGEAGESFNDASSLSVEDCGVAVSMSGGRLPGGAFSPEGDGLGLVGEDDVSKVGERGAPPPHCDINDRTGQVRQSGCGMRKARARQARDCGFRISGYRHVPEILSIMSVSNVPRERGMIAV